MRLASHLAPRVLQARCAVCLRPGPPSGSHACSHGKACGTCTVCAEMIARQWSINYSPSGAIISDCGAYRYALWRRWSPKPLVGWWMLNPSTADAVEPDRTVTKCIGFAKRWGAGGIYVVNLYALRATDPRELRLAPDPVGPDNERHQRQFAAMAKRGEVDRVVVAWGASHERCLRLGAEKRQRSCSEILREHDVMPLCLGTTKSGAPRHPCRIAYATPLRLWC